jgi:L-iditol 2-dehydrogenase
MSEPASVACHAVAQAGLKPGDDVLITGAGTIGLIAAMWCRISGASRIILTDVADKNLEFAQKLGFPLGVNSAREDLPAFIKKNTGRDGVDVCIDCAGFPGAVENCLAAAKPSGRVVLMGNPSGDMTIHQDNYWHILRKELSVTGTWNSTYGGISNDWTRSINAMAAGRLDLSALITHRFDLSQCDEAFRVMREKDVLSIKVMFVNS